MVQEIKGKNKEKEKKSEKLDVRRETKEKVTSYLLQAK